MSVSKFESMLKTNTIYFFDTFEFEEIIQYYLDEGNHSLAKKAIKLSLEQHPSSIILKLLQTELFIFEDRLEKAMTLLTEMEYLEPHNQEIYLQKSIIFSKEKAYKKSIKTLQKGLIFSKDPIAIWEMMAIEYLYLDDFNNARLYFSKCINQDINDYSSLYNVIYCFDMEKKHLEAIDFLNNYIDKNPYSEVAWHQLGCQYFVLNKFKKALEAFDYAILIDDIFIGAYLERAKTLEKLKRYKKAIKSYLITNKLDDPTAFTYMRIGKCFEKLKSIETSIKYYKKAVNEDPLLDYAWGSLANAYFYKKKYKKSLHCITKAIEIDNTNILYRHKCATIYLKLNLHKEAVKEFKKCIDLGDVTTETYINLSDSLSFLGKFNEGLRMVIQAEKTSKGSAEIEYRLCGLFILMGKKSYGFTHLKNGLSIDFERHIIIEKLYPKVFKQIKVQKIIAYHNKQVE